MRKLVIASMLGLFLVLTMAAPAFALRDPFDPVISQAELTGSGADGTGTNGDGTGTNGDGTGTNGDGTDGEGAGADGDGDNVLGENGADGLANTGSETEPWLVAAYALIAIGAGAVLVSKVNAQPV